MKESMGTRRQMSEAVSTGIFLTLSGGFQDAYMYYYRGNVFASAQTGNIVLMESHLAARRWNVVLRYLAPILAFADGVYMVEHVERLHRQDRRLHWKQLIVTIEIILLFVVGLLPQDISMATSIIISFVCALQINTFRKIKRSPYATAMCIENLRNAIENLYWYRHTGQEDHRGKCIRYYEIIDIFAVGATMGSILTAHLRERTIWVNCGLLPVSFLIIFVKEDIEGGHV